VSVEGVVTERGQLVDQLPPPGQGERGGDADVVQGARLDDQAEPGQGGGKLGGITGKRGEVQQP